MKRKVIWGGRMDESDLESRFISDTGMVVVKREGATTFLGISEKADPDAPPQVEIRLTPRQMQALRDELWDVLQEDT